MVMGKLRKTILLLSLIAFSLPLLAAVPPPPPLPPPPPNASTKSGIIAETYNATSRKITVPIKHRVGKSVEVLSMEFKPKVETGGKVPVAMKILTNGFNSTLVINFVDVESGKLIASYTLSVKEEGLNYFNFTLKAPLKGGTWPLRVLLMSGNMTVLNAGIMVDVREPPPPPMPPLPPKPQAVQAGKRKPEPSGKTSSSPLPPFPPYP